jgi:hypothetical protein
MQLSLYFIRLKSDVRQRFETGFKTRLIVKDVARQSRDGAKDR